MSPKNILKFNPRNLIANEESTFGKACKAIVLKHGDYYGYVKNVKGDIAGTRYIVAIPAHQMETIAVKVPARMPIISGEELDERNANGDFVFVSFVDFIGKPYSNYDKDTNTTTWDISYSATDIILVDDTKGKGVL